jgi:hypothetical protein
MFEVEMYGDGQAYIKQDESSISYETLADIICDEMEISPLETIEDYILAMAEKIGKKEGVASFLDKDADVLLSADEDVELDYLFQLARLMDDGHGLTSILVDGAWTCDKMRLGEFGGNSEFCGAHFTMGSGSYIADHLGPTVNRAIDANDINLACSAIKDSFQSILNGIRNEVLRERISKSIKFS